MVIDPDGTKMELSRPADVEAASSDDAWAVWRQDDNGNKLMISGGHTREEAERLCGEFEARGHKQIYWICPMKTAGSTTRRP